MNRLTIGRLVLAAVATLSPISGQTGMKIGGRNTGTSPGLKPSTASKIETSMVVKLGPARNWKSADGRQIAAELVSWPVTDPQAMAKDPRDVRFDVVRDGQVRLRKEKQTFTLPLARLSAEDRAYIQQVIETVTRAKAPPAAGAKPE